MPSTECLQCTFVSRKQFSEAKCSMAMSKIANFDKNYDVVKCCFRNWLMASCQMRNHRQPTLFLSCSLLLFLLLWTVVWRLDLKLLHNRTGRWCEKCEKNPCHKTWYCVLLRAHDVETLIIRSKFMSAQGNRLNKNKLSASQKLLLCFIKCFACSLPWGTFTLLLFVLFLLLSMNFFLPRCCSVVVVPPSSAFSFEILASNLIVHPWCEILLAYCYSNNTFYQLAKCFCFSSACVRFPLRNTEVETLYAFERFNAIFWIDALAITETFFVKCKIHSNVSRYMKPNTIQICFVDSLGGEKPQYETQTQRTYSYPWINSQ